MPKARLNTYVKKVVLCWSLCSSSV